MFSQQCIEIAIYFITPLLFLTFNCEMPGIILWLIAHMLIKIFLTPNDHLDRFFPWYSLPNLVFQIFNLSCFSSSCSFFSFHLPSIRAPKTWVFTCVQRQNANWPPITFFLSLFLFHTRIHTYMFGRNSETEFSTYLGSTTLEKLALFHLATI